MINTNDLIDFKSLYLELYHKVEWCVLAYKELLSYNKTNNDIIEKYMRANIENIFYGGELIMDEEKTRKTKRFFY